ncbi:MAG: hypothetical protein U1F35_00535 [Steroidobacteraceae bacterium]
MVVGFRLLVTSFATLGLLVAVAIVAADRLVSGGFWRPWVVYVFPSSYMIGAASGIIDSFFYEMAAIATIVNAVLYALGGVVVGCVLRGFVKLAKVFRH